MTFEPNEYGGSGEDYGHIYGSGSRKGEWNDYSNSNSSVDGLHCRVWGFNQEIQRYIHN